MSTHSPRRRILTAIIATALLAPLASAASPAAQPTSATLALTIGNDGTAQAVVQQVWTGAAARSLRQSLDAYFGASDGILTNDEITRIAEATRADMVGEKLPWISSQGTPWVVSDVVVAFENAAGRVSSTNEIRMRHDIMLATGGPAVPGSIDIDAPWNAGLQLALPDAYVTSEVAPAAVVAGERTSISISEASEGTPAAPAVPSKILVGVGVAILAVLVLAAVGVGAWYHLTNRKKKAPTA